MNSNDFFSKRTREVSNTSYKKRIIAAFVIFALCIIAGIAAWKWLLHQPTQQQALIPLRKTLEANERILQLTFDSSKKSKVYSEKDAVKKVRVNGLIGMEKVVDTSTWRLQVIRKPGDTLKISLAEIKALPKVHVIFDFKCIEGWNQVTHWAGVPLKTFMEYYHLNAQEEMKYIGLQTINKKYYVGIDMPSALQSQTILCYEMNDKPLPANQGYPLRLIIPVKYGIKHLKQIGTLYFSNEKPPDYWAQRGYDYYAGL
jgi:DMSO/TMAO reductase YedYZ molybdopterin-dependent catalytic subunit